MGSQVAQVANPGEGPSAPSEDWLSSHEGLFLTEKISPICDAGP